MRLWADIQTRIITIYNVYIPIKVLTFLNGWTLIKKHICWGMLEEMKQWHEVDCRMETKLQDADGARRKRQWSRETTNTLFSLQAVVNWARQVLAAGPKPHCSHHKDPFGFWHCHFFFNISDDRRWISDTDFQPNPPYTFKSLYSAISKSALLSTNNCTWTPDCCAHNGNLCTYEEWSKPDF